ncbi:MAG: sulfotransferase family protein [Phycisphaerae bacterium]
MPTANRVIVVLGMQRSGTSTIARAVHALGVPLGNNLLPANIFNPRGYWEDQRIWRLNQQFLDLIGASHQTGGVNCQSILDHPQCENLIAKTTAYLHKQFNHYALWGLKDPHIGRLLPIWKIIFQRLNVQPSYVISVRNPLSIAESLDRCGLADRESGFVLWLENMYSAVSETLQSNSVFVDYDELFGQASIQLLRMANALDLPAGPQQERNIEDFAENFLSENLRGSSYSLQQLRATFADPSIFFDLYECVRMAAHDQLAAPAFSHQWSLISRRYADIHRCLIAGASQHQRLLSRYQHRNRIWKPLKKMEKMIRTGRKKLMQGSRAAL